MNDEFRRKWLQWVLDFVQVDMLKLSRTEKFKLFAEVRFFSSDRLFKVPWENFEKEIQFSHNQFSECERIAPKVQNTLRGLLEYIAPSHQSVSPKTTSYRLPELLSHIDSSVSLRPSIRRVVFHVTFIPRIPTFSNWAILNLARMMNDTWAGVISRCKGCSAYFLNFSMREKIYCSPWCASRTSAQLRRERIYQDPKKKRAYLRKQSKLTMKRYERIRFERTGKKVRHRRKAEAWRAV